MDVRRMFDTHGRRRHGAGRGWAFKTAHSRALGKSAVTVTVADESAVDGALVDYALLSVETKALLTVEKALLDSLKTKIEQLKEGKPDPDPEPEPKP
jgi:hypothetical protein